MDTTKTSEQIKFNVMSKKHLVYFTLVFSLLCLVYGYTSILKFGPYSHHFWRQADCLSFTSNYYYNGMNPFAPAVNYLGMSGDGKTVSEFPIVYYTVAAIWKVLGKQELWYRLFQIGIFFIGLLHLFKLSYRITNDYFWTYLIPLFLFSSPLIVYFTNSFLSDTIALALVFISWDYFYRYSLEKSERYFNVALLFFTLAALLKISALLSFLAVFAVLLLACRFKISKVLNKGQLLFTLISLVVITAWYLLAKWYNKNHNEGFFLQDILPIWEIDAAQRKLVWEKFTSSVLPSIYHEYTFYALALVFIVVLGLWHKNKQWSWHVLMLSIGVTLFFLLFYQVFDVHDYYLINASIFFPFLLISFSNLIKNFNLLPIITHSIKFLFLLLLLFNIYYAANFNRFRYKSNDPLINEEILNNKIDKEFFRWYHWYYFENFDKLSKIEPYLRKLNISRDDKVISLPDITINNTLYLMNQRGYSSFGLVWVTSDSMRIATLKSEGAKYLIINDTNMLQQSNLNVFTHKQIGAFENVKIFDLR